MRTLGTALAAVLLVAGGAYAQQAPEPQDQQRAPGGGTANPPGQESQAPNPRANNTPNTNQPPVAQDQQKAPGTGTAKSPGQPATTGVSPKGPGPAKATPPVPGTGNMDRGSAPGTSTAPKQ